MAWVLASAAFTRTHANTFSSSSQAVVQEWYRGELRRMHTAFKAAASKEVSELRAAVGSLAECNDKLEMQKRLLLAQVRSGV